MASTGASGGRARTVDVAVIGAGTAGLSAYRAAVTAGATAVIVEGGTYGTTCARVGCMPSKLLIAAAEAAHHAEKAAPFGVHATVRVDGRGVMDRIRKERDRFVGFVVESVEQIPDADRLRGRARFVGPGRLEIEPGDGSERLEVTARSVVVATGSSPWVPPVFRGAKDRLVVNDDVFEWETLPGSVAVFGAGVIGLELGQALARLGVRVRLFGRSGTVGPLTDPGVRDAALLAFAEDLSIDTDAKVHAVERTDEGVSVSFDLPGGETARETFDYVLVAAGRRPNLSLGLEEAGARFADDGKPIVDRDTLLAATLDPQHGLFIAGDASDDVPLLHEAADEGRIAGENAARFPDVAPGLRRSLLAVTFTEPQLAVVGASHRALRRTREEGDLVVGEVSFQNQGRSRVMLQNRGRLHVYADPRTGRFLGAEMAGPRAENIGHLLAWAHQQSLTIDQMLAMPFYHPVVEEGLRTALRDASAKLKEKEKRGQ